MLLSRIDRTYAHITVTATLHNGDPATVTAVSVALLPPRRTPTAGTTWTPSAYASGDAVILLAGPDADPDGALTVPEGGADLWVRVPDNPEVQAVKVARIDVS